MDSNPTRGSSFFFGKMIAFGVLCYCALFFCLTLLASFFLPSHLSLKHVYCGVSYELRLYICACTLGVLCCFALFVCLTLLLLSFKNMYMHMYMYVY